MEADEGKLFQDFLYPSTAKIDEIFFYLFLS